MSHEDLTREQAVEGSSDRSFGFVFAVVFVLIGAWPLLSGGAVRWWSMLIAAVFAMVAVLSPRLLAGLNRQWMRLGLLLGHIVSPIALGILFFGVITPLGLALRAFGKDPLRLKYDREAPTYWIPREPPGPPPDSMTNQF